MALQLTKCIQKLVLEQEAAVLIVPQCPNKCWFTELMETTTDCPLILPTECIPLPERTTETIPYKLKPIACPVSGIILETKDVRKKLPISSWSAGEIKLQSNTTVSLLNGRPFVAQGREVVLKPLHH